MAVGHSGRSAKLVKAVAQVAALTDASWCAAWNLPGESLVPTGTMKKLTEHSRTLVALLALVLPGACGAGTQTAALEPGPPRRALDPSTCELDRYAPVSVRPHYEDYVSSTEDFPAARQLRGAEVFVPARPGLTAEWLWHELGVRPGDARSCATGVAGAEIRVTSGGPGFVVTIRGGDEDSGRQILRLSRIDELSAAAAPVGAAP